MALYIGSSKINEVGIGNKKITDIYKGEEYVFGSKSYKIMTARINTANSNPATCVTYLDDAVNMTQGSSDWDTWFGYYPCILKDGVEGVKLNPNNYAQDINGNAVNLASASVGDVMVAFPRMGLKITTNGNYVDVSMTDNPNDPNFEYNAHTRANTIKDKFYLGAYKGYIDNNKLRSWSGKAPSNNKVIGEFRTLARANGSGYEQNAWHQLIFRQCMYVLKYKNLNSQSALGMGYVDASNTKTINTGGTNSKGLNYGSTNRKLQVKLFGIEDFWGNIWEWIDGVYVDSSFNILTATDNFNDTGSNYVNNGKFVSSQLSNVVLKTITGTTKTGFIGKTGGATETTYFCDRCDVVASRVPLHGGQWSNAEKAGIFCTIFSNLPTSTWSNMGARLMYL